MNKFFKCSYIIFLFSSVTNFANAQATYQSEKELKNKGDGLFAAANYSEAYSIYSQLVIRNPKDADYNYHLGVCIIYSAADKEQAIPFLELAAVNSDIEKEVFYYLGKAYLLTYRFENAITQFKIYKEKGSSKNVEKFQVDRQIEMCKNGTNMVRNISDWIVTDKKEIAAKNFFLAYQVPPDVGKLLMKPNEEKYKSSIDIKKMRSLSFTFQKKIIRFIFRAMEKQKSTEKIFIA